MLIITTIATLCLAAYYVPKIIKIKSLLTEQTDMKEKIVEMAENEKYDDLRKLLPICKFSDDRIRRYNPKLASLEEFLVTIIEAQASEGIEESCH